MRKSYNCKEILLNGNFIGFNFGADYCSEHEWGVDEIKRDFGVNVNSAPGIERKKFNPDKFYKNVHDRFHWYEDDKIAGFFFETYPIDDKYSLINREPNPSKWREVKFDNEYASAWSARDFCVFIQKNKKNEKKIINLKKLFEAMKIGDAVVFLGGGGIFENAGLSFCIASKVSDKIKNQWLEADIEKDALKKYEEDTGIHNLLKEANCRFFACSPKRTGNGEIAFWLNPWDQDNNNYGLFTLHELKQWTVGKGPIPKKNNMKPSL